jgi:HipA N-terminal domain
VSRRLEVLLHDLPVGDLSEMPDGGIELRLFDSYRELVPRPVLGQKFEDDLERVHRSRRGVGLPDFFANLIPEGRRPSCRMSPQR